MRQSLRGHQLPENELEFDDLARDGALKHRCCLKCGELFTPDNTNSAAGWRDTQIVGWCERCFDDTFKEDR